MRAKKNGHMYLVYNENININYPQIYLTFIVTIGVTYSCNDRLGKKSPQKSGKGKIKRKWRHRPGAPVICFHVTCLYLRKWRHRELTWGLVKQMKWSEHRPSLPPRLLYSRMLKKPRVSDHALLCEMLGDVAGPWGIPSTELAWRMHRYLNFSCKVREKGIRQEGVWRLGAWGQWPCFQDLTG